MMWDFQGFSGMENLGRPLDEGPSRRYPQTVERLSEQFANFGKTIKRKAKSGTLPHLSKRRLKLLLNKS
ncbi:hypothetical protein M2305_002680 [Gluconobacter cerinus]|nr:hypothetical protein [Gluconobacter cerinus]